MTWLDELVEQHAELESPPSFWKWSALAAISAVVKDNIWMDRQIFRTYPNIYVMLHADSGLKKGPPVNMAKRLVKMVGGTRIITGRSSIQGILKEMGSGQTQPGGKVVSKSVVFICSSELTSSIVEDKVATTILTDLYDRQYNEGEWRSLLKMESFQLKDPTVTMLTASNEAMSDDFFTKAAVQGGYFARTFIVYERDSEVDNSLIYQLDNPPDLAHSAEYLKAIAALRGPFEPLASKEQSDEYPHSKVKRSPRGERYVFFNDSGLLYDDWYEGFKQTIRTQDLKDETGTMNRFGDSVLKVAMLMSLAEHPKLVITARAMEHAIAECEKLIGNARRTALGKQGISASAALKSLVIMELLNRPSNVVTRTILMKKMWMHYANTEEFDLLMQSLHQAKIIETSNHGNQVIYRMPPEEVEQYRKFMASKQKGK